MTIAVLPANSRGNLPWQVDEQGRQYYTTKDGRKVYRTEQEAYVEYNSNSGLNAEINGLGINQTGLYYKPKYNYGNTSTSNTTAYKANAAGTANKIAQGGMTKDDVLKYNIKHPNEIAGDNPANTTALNTNTALRS